MRFLLSVAAALAVGCLAPSPAQSTTMYDQSVAELSASAERVVIGRVTAVRSRLDRSSGVRVFTETTIAVDEVLKGAAEPATVVLTELGGTAGECAERRTQVISGQATWREGELALVFLKRLDTGRLAVGGLSLGKYSLERQASGHVIARREAQGLHRLDMRRRPDRVLAGVPANEDVLSLSDLRRLIAGERFPRLFPQVTRRAASPESEAPVVSRPGQEGVR